LQKILTITLSLPSKFKGKTLGLTGKYDGDKENDFMKYDESGYIPNNSSESEIFDWAQMCEYFAFQEFPLFHSYFVE